MFEVSGLVYVFVQESFVFQVSGGVGDEAGVVGGVVEADNAFSTQSALLFRELLPFVAGTGDVDFGLPHDLMVVVPKGVESFG